MGARRPEDYRLSVVIPVFDEDAALPRLAGELARILDGLVPSYELIFVDDHSRDGTAAALQALHHRDRRVKTLRLSRNMGHQAALACGMEAASGDVVITMDGDLQHPPSLIPEMIAKWREGYDVVNMVRRHTAGAGAAERVFSAMFYRLYNSISPVKITPAAADFRLLDRRALSALNALPERAKFYRGLVPFIGFDQTELEFDCPPRQHGERRYTWRQSLKLALNGFFAFSTAGLRIPLYAGGLILALALGYFAVAAALVITGRTPLVTGWMSIVALIFLGIGLQCVFMGMFGLYLGHVFMEVKRRPVYFIERATGFATMESAAP